MLVPAVAETNTSVAAERNKEPILQQLRQLLPDRASVLEIASGTGQHVSYFADALPGTHWQPSDPNADSLASIRTRLQGAPRPQIADPLCLDVHQTDWGLRGQFDAVLAINLIHIAPWSATGALMAGACRAFRPDGARLLILYGPYRQTGVPLAPSNAEFDRSLQQRNPAWGLRELDAVSAVAADHGLHCHSVQALPANNLLVVYAG